MFVEVAFPLPLNRTFHYRALNGERPDAFIGRRVLAPFGRKTLVGYAVGSQEQTPNFPTKPIQAWLDTDPLLDASLLELAQWLAHNYLCSYGEAFSAILPPQLRAPKHTRTEV